MPLQHVRTETLDIGVHVDGPRDGKPVLLLHGWPDSPRFWNGVAPRFHAAGWKTIAPFLRGSGPTRFLSPATPRVGQAVALTQDIVDLMDRLELRSVHVAGHDWGARIAYALAALVPERIIAIAALSVAYQPGASFPLPSFAQARLYWYQWFMSVDRGAEAVRADPIGFARSQWDTWSPAGWYDEQEFAATAESFTNPDWVDITLSAYRSRWRTSDEAVDPRYDDLQRRLANTARIATPALIIQGGSDRCTEPSAGEDRAHFFTGPYERIVLEGIGHFPARESPRHVAETMLRYFQTLTRLGHG